MSKKPLGKDKSGIQKVMRTRDYLGDSLGMFALNAISGLVGQLTYYYTDKVHMAAASIATMFIICKIIDAFTDIIMGNIVDHTKPGKEKYRPWLLKAGIPAGVLVALIFMVPAEIGNAGQIAYAMITNLLLTAVLYTAVCIPYASLMNVRTNSQEERGTMGTFRAAAGYVSGMIIAICIIPITNALGGTQSAWIKFGVVAGILVVLAFLITYLTSKETAVEVGKEAEITEVEDEEPVPFWESIRMLFGNKYWVIVLVVNFMSCIMYGITGASVTYYCKWIFGDDNLVAILGGIGLIPTFLGFALLGVMIKKLGIAGTLKFSFSLGVFGNLALLLFRDKFAMYAVFGSINTFATIPMMALVGVMTSMAIDYNKYKYDKKLVATSNSASGFGGKIGSGVGASIIGWTLGAVGYDPTLAVAPEATKMAIYGFAIIIPLIMFVAMLILVCQFDLEEKLPAMREEIVARKANQV